MGTIILVTVLCVECASCGGSSGRETYCHQRAIQHRLIVSQLQGVFSKIELGGMGQCPILPSSIHTNETIGTYIARLAPCPYSGENRLFKMIRIFAPRFQNWLAINNKKAQLTQSLLAKAPLFQDGRQPPSWILSNRKYRNSIHRPRKLLSAPLREWYSPLNWVKPSELRNDPSWRKTRMMGLSDNERTRGRVRVGPSFQFSSVQFSNNFMYRASLIIQDCDGGAHA